MTHTIQDYTERMRAELHAKIHTGPSDPPVRPEKPPFGETIDPNCNDCGGTGWSLSEKYNRYFMCKCAMKAREAAEQKRVAQRSVMDLSNIGLAPADLSLTWDVIKPGYSDGSVAVEAIRPAYERGYGLIFLWGAYGQAKTVIGKILVAQAHRDGRTAAYANFLEALDNIRQAFDAQEGKTTELIRRVDWWTSRKVLFLDEFDKCNDTSWALERKFQIVDRCYQRAIREEALTVIASNHGDDGLDGYIKSRLKDQRVGPILNLRGPDGRQVMPPSWKY